MRWVAPPAEARRWPVSSGPRNSNPIAGSTPGTVPADPRDTDQPLAADFGELDRDRWTDDPHAQTTTTVLVIELLGMSLYPPAATPAWCCPSGC